MTCECSWNHIAQHTTVVSPLRGLERHRGLFQQALKSVRLFQQAPKERDGKKNEWDGSVHSHPTHYYLQLTKRRADYGAHGFTNSVATEALRNATLTTFTTSTTLVTPSALTSVRCFGQPGSVTAATLRNATLTVATTS